MNRPAARARAGGSLLAAWLAAPGCVMEVRVGDNLPDDPDDPSELLDFDRDGYSEAEGDCDDGDPLRGPADDPTFVEQCDGIDNDCAGAVDETEDGLAVCAREARFVQRLELDLLFVIDRSARNDTPRERAAAALPELLTHLVGPSLDTHVGVVTMDLDDPEHSGHLVRPVGATRSWVLGRNDSLPAAVSFLRQGILDSGVQLGGDEGGRAAVSLAMSESTAATNAGFFRRDVPLGLVFVSGEDDATQAPDVFGFVEQLEESAASVRAHAVVQTSAFGCDGKESGSEGASYLDLALLTNGLSQSVCEETFGPFFSVLGQYSAIQGLGSRFPLNEPAQPVGVQVEVELPGGATRTLLADEFGLTDAGSTLVLLTDPLPPAGTEIRVSYLRTP